MKNLFLLVCLSFTLAATAADAQDIAFSSGVQQVALVELYTSEGCSSCPPADRWMSTLTTDAGLWESFVPIAFHVDYWDYIGWQDRFAKSKFSSRQRQYAEEGASRSVYTPGFFASGNEWLGWRNNEDVTPSLQDVGNLSVRLRNKSVAVHFAPEKNTYKKLTAHVALLGMDLETEVRAGENRGRKLRHDFVALEVASAQLKDTAAGHSVVLQLPETKIATSNQAVVVWISGDRRQAPIQVTGSYLP